MFGFEQAWWLVVPSALIGLGFLLYRSGLDFDAEQQRFRVFFTVFGIKVGKWEPLSAYPDLVVLRSKKKSSDEYLEDEIPSYSSDTWVEYELYLASPNHFKLILVNHYDDKMAAYHAAEDLLSFMGCQLVQYNPGRRRPRKLLSVQNGKLVLDDPV